MKRIQLSPSRKLTYFEKYRKFIDKEKLFLEEMVRISYNLGRNDVIQEDIENHKRLFPEPEDKVILTKKIKQGNLRVGDEIHMIEAERSEDEINLTGLKSKRGKK